MRAHFDAVRARLNADPGLAGKGHDSAIVDAGGLPVRATYWVLYGGGPDVLDDGRLASPQAFGSDAEYVYTVRCVSPTADGVRAAATRVLSQMVGFIPIVAGRTCSPIRLTDVDDVQPDDSITPPLYFADCELTLISSRA